MTDDHSRRLTRRRFLALTAAGSAALALPTATRVSADGGKRILIVGDSILNSLDVRTAIAAHVPQAVTQVWCFGGSMSTMGLFLLAERTYQAAQPTNLVAHRGPKNWKGFTGVTLDRAQSPATGAAVLNVTADGTYGEHISAIPGHGSLTAGNPPLPLQFRATVEPGSLQSFGLQLINATRNGTIAASYWQWYDLARLGNLPMPYLLQATPSSGVGYGPGDIILPRIQPGSASQPKGNLYLSGVRISWGGDPGVSEDPYLAPAAVSDGKSPLFDLVVVVFGRNDAANYAQRGNAGFPAAPSPDSFRQILTGVARAARNYAPRVLICTPPPMTDADRSAWAAQDPYVDQGYQVAAAAAAQTTQSAFFNAVDAFRQAAAAGTPLTTLMQDPVHPTVEAPNLAGANIYAQGIAAALAAGSAAPAPAPAVTSTSYLAAERQDGDWSSQLFTSGQQSGYSPFGLAIGMERPSQVRALVSTQPGAVLHYAVQGQEVGIITLVDQNAVGVAEVALNGEPITTLNCYGAGAQMYPRGLYIPWSGSPGRGDLTITVQSGQVRVVGLVTLQGV